MGYKIVKALQNLDFAKRHVKQGDQIELEAAEADDLIRRGLAEAGSMESPAAEAHPEDLTKNADRDRLADSLSARPGATDTVRPLSGGSFTPAPENKMSPDASPK